MLLLACSEHHSMMQVSGGTDADKRIDDYDRCRWQTGLVADCQKKQQPGDPDKLADVIIKVSQSDNPPLHLGIGEDAPNVMYSFASKIKEDTDALERNCIQYKF